MEHNDEELWVTCECGDTDHTVRVSVYKDMWRSNGIDDPQFVVEPLYNSHFGFFKRIWVAFKYIFLKHPIGGFGEILVTHENVLEIGKLVNAYVMVCKVREAKRTLLEKTS